MFSKSLKRFSLVLLVACLALCLRANAQTTTQGSISGTVFDKTNAAVPGASVVIHNDGTNAEIKLTSDNSGGYKAPILEPGTYTVTVTAPGFNTYHATKVVVQVGITTNLEPMLSAGGEGTTVEVVAEAPVLNFESPDFASNLNQKALQNIPINNRRWSALAMTTPGVVSDSNGFGLVSVRGISTLLNNVLIDGADDNDAYWSEERGRTREAYSTSENAVREFNVNTGVYSAQFGRAAGGVINSVTKSGTNALHGQAYFYDRQSSWGAFNNYTKITTAVGSPIPTSFNTFIFKPKDLRKIYGFTVGGPIVKDKIFFTYTYDQHSRIFPAVGAPASPGSFFVTPDAGTAGSNVVGNYTCLSTGFLAITGNQGVATTASTIDQAACTLAARLGTTYAAGAALYTQNLAALLPDLGSTPRTGYQEINTPKLDWQITPTEHLSLLYHRLRWDSPGGVQTSAVVNYSIDAQGTDFVKVDYGVAKLTSLLNSSLSNEILYQYGHEILPEGQQPFSAYTLANLVATGGNIPYLQNLGGSSTGFSLGSPYYSYRPALPDERKWQIADTLYWNKGRHAFKFGGDVLHNWDLINALNGAGNAGSSAQNGTYYYPNIGNYFVDLATKGHAGTCDSKASATATPYAASGAVANATGSYQCYSAFNQTFGVPSYFITTMDYGFFAQDNWKFSPRLTLELGIRYDYQSIPAPSANLVNPAVPQTTYQPSDKNNIGPRAGFAYDVYGSGKTVLRGGYGMYYGRILNGVLLNVRLNTGVAAGQYTTNFAPQSGSAGTAPVFPNNVASGSLITPGVYYTDKNLQNPMVHEFDLSVQQVVGRGTVASISYLGALGRELPNYIDTNLSTDSAHSQIAAITVADPTGKGPIKPGVYNVRQYTSYVKTAYQNITALTSNVTSNYNGLSAEIQNRSLKSIQFDFSYTWSHGLDYYQNVNTGATSESWMDPLGNPRANYGNTDFDIRNRFVGYVLYTAPNFVHKGSWLGYLVNGWSIDNSFQMQSGLPYSAQLSSASTKITSNQVLGGQYGAGSSVSFLPLAGRNNFQLPRDIVDDGRLQKGINFTDRYTLQLFANVFNIANHQNVTNLNKTGYNVSGSGAGVGTLTYNGTNASATNHFGTVSNTNNQGFLYTPRLIEIGAKFNF